MSNFNKLFPYSYEQNGEDGQPQIEVAYSLNGEIGGIFVYNPLIDAMVKVDIEAFGRMHPSKYDYLQEQVTNLLPDIIAEENEGLICVRNVR